MMMHDGGNRLNIVAIHTFLSGVRTIGENQSSLGGDASNSWIRQAIPSVTQLELGVQRCNAHCLSTPAASLLLLVSLYNFAPARKFI